MQNHTHIIGRASVFTNLGPNLFGLKITQIFTTSLLFPSPSKAHQHNRWKRSSSPLQTWASSTPTASAFSPQHQKLLWRAAALRFVFLFLPFSLKSQLTRSKIASSGRRRTRESCRLLRVPWRARRHRCRSRCCRRRWRAPTAPAPSPIGSPPTTRARPPPSRSSGSTSSSIPSRPSSKTPALDPIRSDFRPFRLLRRQFFLLTAVLRWYLQAARRERPHRARRAGQGGEVRAEVCAPHLTFLFCALGQ